MKIGYARVSTHDQTTALQLDALKAAGCDRIFEETGSGADTQRPQLAAALDHLREGDTFIIWRFDRIGRSTKHLMTIFDDLKCRNIGLKSLTEGIDTSTTTGQLMFGIISLFAEFERSVINERATAGREAARARGIVGGRRRKLADDQIALLKKMGADRSISLSTILNTFQVSKSAYYQYLNRPE
jgi:DNA invertase Pin-like site-specific DNA recombinase